MQQSLHRRALFLLALIVVVAVTLISAAQAKRRVERRVEAGRGISAVTVEPKEANDFDRWMRMVPAFLAGRQDYVNDRFPTPPITIAIFAPLTLVSPGVAQFIWVCCKPVLAFLVFWFCREMVKGAGTRMSGLAVGLIVAAWFWPMIGDMQEGQTNLLMLAPLTAGLWLAQREESRWDWGAGILLGLAVSIKVTPVIFVIYFLWRRRWRLGVAAFCGVGIFLVILPALIFGVQRNQVWLVGWTEVMIYPYVVRGEVVYPNGESVASMMTRFLEHVPAFELRRGDGLTPFYVNVVNLSDWAVGWIVRGTLAGLLAGGLVWMRRPLMTLRCQRYVGEIGAVAAFMLWASERTWVAHYVTMVLPLCAVGMVASYRWFSAGVRRLAYGGLVLAVVMMVLTSDVAKWVFGPYGREMAMMVNVPMWASAILVGVLMWAGLPDRGRGEGVGLNS